MSRAIGIVKRWKDARPKCGPFTANVHCERPLRNQPPPIENGFVEPSPSRALRDGEGTFSVKVRRTLAALVLCLAAGIAIAPRSLSSAQKDKNAQPASTGPAAAPVFTPDKGKFRIVLDGNAVGSEDFEISPVGDTWMARGTTTAHVPGGTDIKATGQLKLAPDGAPMHYEWSAQLQKKATGIVDFVNGTAKCTIDLGTGTPIIKEFTFASPRVAVLDNNFYYQYDVLAQMYDWKTGGKQTFPVVIPQDMVPGSITVESVGPQQVENATYESLRVASTDLEILLYVDANHRMVRLDVPSSNVTIRRE